MFKHKVNTIGSYETGETIDIVVNATCPNTFKEIVIGVGIVSIGIIYLTVSAFKNGATAHDKMELAALRALNLLLDPKTNK